MSTRHTATVRSNFPALVEAKAAKRGQTITPTDIVFETQLSPNTVGAWLRSEQTRFDGHVIAALCLWLDCRIEDLLQIVDPGKSGVGKPDDKKNQTPLQ